MRKFWLFSLLVLALMMIGLTPITAQWGTEAGCLPTGRGPGVTGYICSRTSTFATRALAAAATIGPSIDYIILEGYAAPNDSPRARYTRIATPGAPKAWQFQTVDGQWWEIDGRIVYPEQLGAKTDAVTVTDTVSIAQGSQTLTTGTPHFSASDVGKYISIQDIGSQIYGITLAASGIDFVASRTWTLTILDGTFPLLNGTGTCSVNPTILSISDGTGSIGIGNAILNPGTCPSEPSNPAFVAGASITTGGTGFGNTQTGNITWSGAGCSVNPILNVVTNSSGVIIFVDHTVNPGVCSVPVNQAATTWTASAPLSAGTGASFSVANSQAAFTLQWSPLATTITGFTNSTTVTVADPSSRALAAVQNSFLYATADTTSINNAFGAANAYALANGAGTLAFCGNYAVDSQLFGVTANNGLSIIGICPNSKIYYVGSGTYPGIIGTYVKGPGVNTASTTFNLDANYGDQVISVTSTTGFAVGDYIQISACGLTVTGPGGPMGEVNRIVAFQPAGSPGGMILQKALGFQTYKSTSPAGGTCALGGVNNSIRTWTTSARVSVLDMEFDGTYTSSRVIGIDLQYLVDANIRVKSRNMRSYGAGGIGWNTIYGGTYTLIDEGSGSTSTLQSIGGQYMSAVRLDEEINNSNGFGTDLDTFTSNILTVRLNGSYGRGFKTSGFNDNEVISVHTSNAKFNTAFPPFWMEGNSSNNRFGTVFAAGSAGTLAANCFASAGSFNRHNYVGKLQVSNCQTPVAIANSDSIEFGSNVSYSPTALASNDVISLESATVVSGGTGWGASVTGNIVWTGTGCATPPIMNVTTNGIGAITTVNYVVVAGCTQPPLSTATNWVVSSGLSAGSGASFAVVSSVTGRFNRTQSTLTFPDASTWTWAGINNLSHIGIGAAAPTYPMVINDASTAISGQVFGLNIGENPIPSGASSATYLPFNVTTNIANNQNYSGTAGVGQFVVNQSGTGTITSSVPVSGQIINGNASSTMTSAQAIQGLVSGTGIFGTVSGGTFSLNLQATSGTQVTAAAYGAQGAIANIAGGTVVEADTLIGSLTNSNGTISTARGLYLARPVGAVMAATATWTSLFGAQIANQNPTGAGTNVLTNPPEGLHIDSQTATGAYAIHQAGLGINLFESGVTTSIVYGGSAAGSSLTLAGTSSGAPSGDSIIFSTGAGVAQTIALGNLTSAGVVATSISTQSTGANLLANFQMTQVPTSNNGNTTTAAQYINVLGSASSFGLTGVAIGALGEVFNNSTQSIAQARALYGLTRLSTNATITLGYAIYSNTTNTGGTCSSCYGLFISQPVGGSANPTTFTTMIGANIDNQLPSGTMNTITNATEALHIASQTGAGAFAIRQVGSGINSFASPLTMSVAASTLTLKQGANGSVGTFVCTGAGTITVNNTNIAISDGIGISLNAVGGTISTAPIQKTITAATSFTVLCGAADTSTYNYWLIKNAA